MAAHKMSDFLLFEILLPVPVKVVLSNLRIADFDE